MTRELARIEVGHEADLAAILDRTEQVTDPWAQETIVRLAREVAAQREAAGALSPPPPDDEPEGQLRDRIRAVAKRARLLGAERAQDVFNWGELYFAAEWEAAVDTEAGEDPERCDLCQRPLTEEGECDDCGCA